MQKLFFALSLLAILLPFEAFAAKQTRDPANNRARALIAKMKSQKPPAIAATPLLNFSSSPQIPLQNRALTWMVQFDNPFTNRLLSIDVKNNGQAVTNVQSPYKGMFVVDLGVQSIVGSQSMVVTLFAESASNNADVRSAISAIDTNIRQLTNQINSQRDPALRARLQEQRNEKIALKNELVTQLKAYRWKLGTQTQSFTVQADPNSTSSPKITGISPVTGTVAGGTEVTISGQNFSQNVSAYFGGVASPNVTYVNPTTVQAVTPSFSRGAGAKDVELRFTSNGKTVNAISPGAFFASSGGGSAPGVNHKPVAVASGSSHVHLGNAVQLDGMLSYDNEGDPFSYSWSVVNTPANSSFSAGQALGIAGTQSFIPDVVGTFVLQLITTETSTSDHFLSDPSIVVLQVNGGPNPVAGAIVAKTGDIGTSQVLANDSSPGESFSYAITQAPLHGTASVSSAGLVSYQASNYFGSDSLIVKVTNRAGLFGMVTIPVTVIQMNYPPEPTANNISTHTEEGVSQVYPNDPDQGQSHSYSISTQPQHGIVMFYETGRIGYTSEPGYTGIDSFIVRVTDDGGNPNLSGFVTINVTVSPNSTPQIAASAIQIAQDTTSISQITISDDPGQTGLFSFTPPEHGTASISSTGLVTYIPNTGFAGTDQIDVVFSDNGNPFLSSEIDIDVTVNGRPVASAPAIQSTGETAVSQIAATDPNEGQVLSYSIQTAPTNGTAIINGSGLVSYTPDSGFLGSDSLIARISDSGVPSLYVDVTIPVTIGTNNAPMASAPPITVGSNGTSTSQISASDPDSWQSFTYSIATPPSYGTASVNGNGLVSYTSSASYVGNDSIVARVTDNGVPQLSVDITIPVTVVVGTPPVIGNLKFFLMSQGFPVNVFLFPDREVITASGNPAKVVWDFGDGTHEKSTGGFPGAINHDYIAAGTYTATITATDDLGVSSSKSLSVVVVDTDIPTAKFTASSFVGSAPFTVNFDASAATDADGIATYVWNWTNGYPFDDEITASPTISHTFTQSGVYQVRLATIDSHNASTILTAYFFVDVTPPGNGTAYPAIADFQVAPARRVLLGSPFIFDGTRSFDPNPGVNVTSYQWNFGDYFASCGDGCTSNAATPNYTYENAFEYYPRLQVAGPDGTYFQPAWQRVMVVNAGFAPRSLPEADIVAGVAPLTVHFTNESYDTDGTIADYYWHFNDPNCTNDCEASGSNASHTYCQEGLYQASLVVTDNDGNVNRNQVTIDVNAAGKASIRGKKKPRSTPVFGDPTRENKRQILANACSRREADSCYFLSKIYAEDGNENLATKFKAKSCTIGYQPACQ